MECEYGCGEESKFTLKSGKVCCSENYQSCPEMRHKNSKGCKKAGNGGDGGYKFTKEDRKKGNEKLIFEAIDKVFQLNSGADNGQLRRYLLEYKGREYRCEICGIMEWLGKQITLDLDHIDGNNQNNVEINLRFLCPNCHSQTETFRGKNINNGHQKVSDDELISALQKEKSVRQALLSVGLAAKGGNYTRAYRLQSQY